MQSTHTNILNGFRNDYRERDYEFKSLETIVDALETFHQRFGREGQQKAFDEIKAICHRLHHALANDKQLSVKEKKRILADTHKLERQVSQLANSIISSAVKEAHCLDMNFVDNLLRLITKILRYSAEFRNCYLYTNIMPQMKNDTLDLDHDDLEIDLDLIQNNDEKSWATQKSLDKFEQFNSALKGLQVIDADHAMESNRDDFNKNLRILSDLLPALEKFLKQQEAPRNINEAYAQRTLAFEEILVQLMLRILPRDEYYQSEGVCKLINNFIKAITTFFEFNGICKYESVNPITEKYANKSYGNIAKTKEEQVKNAEVLTHHNPYRMNEKRFEGILESLSSPISEGQKTKTGTYNIKVKKPNGAVENQEVEQCEQDQVYALSERGKAGKLNLYDAKQLTQKKAAAEGTAIAGKEEVKVHNGKWNRFKNAVFFAATRSVRNIPGLFPNSTGYRRMP